MHAWAKIWLLGGAKITCCWLDRLLLFGLFCFTEEGENYDFFWLGERSRPFLFIKKNKPSNPTVLLSVKGQQATQRRQIFNLVAILALTFAPFHIHARMARKAGILSGSVTLNLT